MKWLSIPGLHAYQVSDAGRIRGVWGRPLTTSRSDSGYKRVKVTIEGKRRWLLVHRAVLMAFVGPPPSPIHRGAHDDGDKDNNTLGNLLWKLPVENEADKKRHGTQPRGGRVWRPNRERIERIRERAKTESFTKIARDEGLHRSSVSRIVRGLRRRAA